MYKDIFYLIIKCKKVIKAIKFIEYYSTTKSNEQSLDGSNKQLEV